MKIIKKIKEKIAKAKEAEHKTDFLDTTEPGPMTGGNSFEVYQQLKLQEQIDKDNLISKDTTAKNVNQKIKAIAKKHIHDKQFSPWILLQFQANYFCGTCKFECDDTIIKQKILKLIRGAFLMGCAGMYKQEGFWTPVYVSSVTYSIDGTISEAKIYELDNAITFLNQARDFGILDCLTTKTVTGDDANNLVIFQWGVMGLPAWLTIWPFVQFQHTLLDTLISYSLNYNKKWNYNVKQESFTGDEIEAMFDPTNPIIVTYGSPDELRNRFNLLEFNSKQDSDIIDYYNKVINAYYHIIGRRVNNDMKKERNITDEVEASQENYDIVQSDWLNFFEIFCKEFTTKSGIQVNVIKEEDSYADEGNFDDGKDNDLNNE